MSLCNKMPASGTCRPILQNSAKRPRKLAMKIDQIPLGTRFEYKGEEYVKSGPLFGTGKGGQCLIPKYAIINVLGGFTPPTDQKTAVLSRIQVLKAFDEFYASCRALVPVEQLSALNSCRSRFLKELD